MNPQYPRNGNTSSHAIVSSEPERAQIPNAKELKPLTRRTKSVNDLPSTGFRAKAWKGQKRRLVQSASCSPFNSSKVCFGSVTIFEFATIIGDSPEVADGCPIALAPTALQNSEPSTMPVQVYERNRDFTYNRDVRRLTAKQRSKMLQDAGYSQADISKATSEAASIRLNRERSIRQVPWDGVRLLLEKTTRGLRKMIPVRGAPSNMPTTTPKLRTSKM